MAFGFCRTSVLIPSEDGILIIAVPMQRFSNLVFSCSNLDTNNHRAGPAGFSDKCFQRVKCWVIPTAARDLFPYIGSFPQQIEGSPYRQTAPRRAHYQHNPDHPLSPPYYRFGILGLVR